MPGTHQKPEKRLAEPTRVKGPRGGVLHCPECTVGELVYSYSMKYIHCNNAVCSEAWFADTEGKR